MLKDDGMGGKEFTPIGAMISYSAIIVTFIILASIVGGF